MDRTAITEIRKIFSYNGKEGDLSVVRHSGCFINTSKEIKGTFKRRIREEEKDTMLKFLDIHKKTLSNGNSDISFDEKDKKDGGIQFLLDKIKATELDNDSITRILYEKIAEALPENNYVVTLSYSAYDVPIKTKDKLKVDDAGDEVYKFITCAICPVKTGKGSLGYLPDEEKIGENPRLLVLDKPAFGFIYPAFNDRSADIEALSCFATDELNISEALFSHVATIEKTEKKVPKKKAEKTDDTRSVSEGVSTTASFPDYSSSTSDIPSLDTGTLNNDAHYIEERTITEDPEDVAASAGPSVNEILSSQKQHHKKHSVTIKGSADRIKKQTVDGIECYVIPVSDAQCELLSAD